MTAPKKHPNHRIGQEQRRRKEAVERLDADAAERDVRVLNQAKAYTDERVDAVWQAVRELQQEEQIERDYEEQCAPRLRAV